MSPDAALVSVKVQDLRRTVAEIDRLVDALLQYSSSLSWNGKFETAYAANMALLYGRGDVLRQLIRGFDQALDGRNALLPEIEAYEASLRASAPPPQAEAPAGADAETPYDKIQDLRGRWKVLAYLKRQRVAQQLKQLTGADHGAAQEELAQLDRHLVNYALVPNRADYLREYDGNLTLPQARGGDGTNLG